MCKIFGKMPKKKKAKGPTTIPLAEAVRSWQAGRTQAKAAKDLGVNLRTYQNWVQGRTEPQGLAYRVISSTVYDDSVDGEE